MMKSLDILVMTADADLYRHLRQMLCTISAESNVIGPLQTVEESRVFLSYHKDVDIIITDTQLADGLSFQALDKTDTTTPVIFISSTESHAFEAFAYNSLSYLLKPASADQLKAALERASRIGHNRGKDGQAAGGVYWPILSYAPTRVKYRRDPAHSRCILVETAKGERRIHLSTVRYAVSEDKTTYLRLLDGSSYPLGLTLQELAEHIDGKSFMRVNRKYIVPLEQVKGVEKLPNGRLRLMLYADDEARIIVSRDMRERVMEWLKR